MSPFEIEEFERLLRKPNSDPTGLASLFASGPETAGCSPESLGLVRCLKLPDCVTQKF
jgi:hypothetical protein